MRRRWSKVPVAFLSFGLVCSCSESDPVTFPPVDALCTAGPGCVTAGDAAIDDVAQEDVPAPADLPSMASEAPLASGEVASDLPSPKDDAGPLDQAIEDTALGTPADAEASVDAPIGTGDEIDALPDTPRDLPYAQLYPCRDDSDCCIVVQRMRCQSGGDTSIFLYSRAPGALPPPPPLADACTLSNYSLCPRVQTRCMSGQCVARAIQTWEAPYPGYCDSAGVDGGNAPWVLPDGGVPHPETSWQCMPPPG